MKRPFLLGYNVLTKKKTEGLEGIKEMRRYNIMLFKSKKKAEKKKLLYRENIRVNCKAKTQEEVIKEAGQMLVDAGYVSQPYVEAMLKREESCSTFMGNGLALPHGVEEAKKDIKESGIAVMTFPEGTPWGDNTANVVVGIAGVGEEHLQILSVIAEKMLDESVAEKLANGDIDTVYSILGD